MVHALGQINMASVLGSFGFPPDGKNKDKITSAKN